MSDRKLFDIQKYIFEPGVIALFHDNHYAKTHWPVVYILSDDNKRKMYIGETADVYTRMETHLIDDNKNHLSTLHIITSEKFNKSATLDIEANLIKYISGEEGYELLNGNIGLANHNYYQKNHLYWDIFKDIWHELKDEGIANNTLKHISNSNLFKYSPYKSLSQDQCKSLIRIMENLLNDDVKTTFIEGGAGTGKSVLGVFLFKLLSVKVDDINLKEFGENELKIIELLYKLKDKYSNGPKMALVVPVSPFRKTLQKVFKHNGLDENIVISPNGVLNEEYDIIVVDEAHRLRRGNILGPYYGEFKIVSGELGLDYSTHTELDWMLMQGEKVIIFYDQTQTVRPSDVVRSDFTELKSEASTTVQKLKSQLRVKGGNGYIDYIDKLLNCSFNSSDNIFATKDYSFSLFNSLEDMVNEIKQRDQEYGLSRLIAGYSWPWVSKKDETLYDIEIENVSLQWNRPTGDWINSENAINEVGCIHTSQGYDLNYTGIIFGREISYDEKTNSLVIIKENYCDRNGKAGVYDPQQLKDYIINIYSTILKRGINGTYVYVCDEALRNYLSKHIPPAKVQHKQNDIVKQIKPISNLILAKSKNESNNLIPFLDIKAAAGGFSPDQLPNFKKIVLPADLKPTNDMFACQVVGESMNEKIPNGAICLFKFDQGGSRDGKTVLVQHTKIQDSDYGNGFTVKVYKSEKTIGKKSWRHKLITLSPRSNDSSYKPIRFYESNDVKLDVIGIFVRILYENGDDYEIIE